jgi:hypothetical protein
MDLEQHIKTILGDLVFTVAKQAAELDALKAPTPSEPPPSDPA